MRNRTKQYPSIFNDVIGPVMIGPSSSHTAGSVRIGRLVRQLINDNHKIKQFLVEFDRKTSIAATYHSQCADVGLAAGILGMDTQDPKLMRSLELAKQEGIEINFVVTDFPTEHTNTYKMTIIDEFENVSTMTALSIGGGMLTVTEINGISVNIDGGFYETLVFNDGKEETQNQIKEILKDYSITYAGNNGKLLIAKNSQNRLPIEREKDLLKLKGVTNVICLDCVLPISSQITPKVPFASAEEMLKYGEGKLKLWQLALRYESARGNISEDEVFSKMRELVEIMNNAIDSGLAGTEYEDRILGNQSQYIATSKLVGGSLVRSIIRNISAIMEHKSAMGVIVAAPTSGACSGLPGTIISIAREEGLDNDEITKAMLAAGMIGVFIAEFSTFSGEVGGCQAECGSGSGMAATGVVELMGGNAEQAVDAAAMALQNIVGMACTPIAGRVEVPCLGNNIMCGFNALASANMAIAGYDKVISLDDTIKANDPIGRSLPIEYRCTSQGGIAITTQAKEIEKRLL